MDSHEDATLALPRKRSRTLAQEVVEDLTARIRKGVYPVGQKLPTEPEVMAQQGVSRTVVREAISRLQAAGLVETRHGIGTFVLAARSATRSPLDLSTVVTIRDVLAMLELRISLEAEAAGLAAQRRSKGDLVLMRRALATFERSIADGGDAVGPDFQFHLQIALATGNKHFEEILRNLGTATIPRTRLDIARLSSEPAAIYLGRVNREHESVFEAIARKDPESARAAMRVHLNNSRERLRRASRGQAGPNRHQADSTSTGRHSGRQ